MQHNFTSALLQLY